MIIVYYKSGLTAGGTTSAAPPAGKRWKVRNATITLAGSSTTGSRSASLSVQGVSGTGNVAYLLATTSQGATSASATTYGVGAISPTSNANTTTEWADYPVMSEEDTLLLNVSLQSGDTVSWNVEVEEEEAD